jgi:peptide/nickel transport system permease protein
VIARHIIPNAIDEVLILGSIALGAAIIIEAALSFLGLGTQPPDPSWGKMLAEGRTVYEKGPHMVWVPSVVISVTVLAVNMVGDSLRDILDPKVRGGSETRF